jgi:flagellar motor switch protein FliM
MGQVLSEGEVDALLKGVGDGEVNVETDQVDELTGVSEYDLTSQEKIIAGRLPTLDIINQMFSRYFASRLGVCSERQLKLTPFLQIQLNLANFYALYLLQTVFIFLGWSHCVGMV